MERDRTMKINKIRLSREQVKQFCDRWQITEFALFGSVLRDDFHPESDIDILVTFAPEAHHTLFDLVRMENELKEIFKRDVDLVSRRGIERSLNYLRRHEILSSAQVIYAA
jgi:predicted nucleotidyltransferase